MSSLPRRLASLLLLGALASGTSGCSWIFVQKAPEPVLVPNLPISCDDQKAAPILDSVCAGYFLASGLVVLSAIPDTAEGRDRALLLYGALAAVCALSAHTGFSAVGHCQQVKALNTLCVVGNEGACRSLTPGWTPPLRLAPPRPVAPPAAAPAPDQPPAAPVQPAP